MLQRSNKMVTRAPKGIKIEANDNEQPGLMPLPETLKVGPHDYVLGTFDLLSSMQNGRIGEQDYFQLEINMLEGMKPSMQAEVQMHEAFHALWETTGLRGFNGEIDEEHAVTVLAKNMLMLFRENPAWLAAVLQRAGVGVA